MDGIIVFLKTFALFLIDNDIVNDNANGVIVCEEMSDDELWTGVTKDEIETLMDEEYQTFAIWKRVIKEEKYGERNL